MYSTNRRRIRHNPAIDEGEPEAIDFAAIADGASAGRSCMTKCAPSPGAACTTGTRSTT